MHKRIRYVHTNTNTSLTHKSELKYRKLQLNEVIILLNTLNLMHIEFGRKFFRYTPLVLFRQFLEINGMFIQSEIAEIALENKNHRCTISVRNYRGCLSVNCM